MGAAVTQHERKQPRWFLRQLKYAYLVARTRRRFLRPMKSHLAALAAAEQLTRHNPAGGHRREAQVQVDVAGVEHQLPAACEPRAYADTLRLPCAVETHRSHPTPGQRSNALVE